MIYYILQYTALHYSIALFSSSRPGAAHHGAGVPPRPRPGGRPPVVRERGSIICIYIYIYKVREVGTLRWHSAIFFPTKCICAVAAWKKHSSEEENPLEDKPSECQIRGWRAAYTPGLRGRGSPNRNIFFTETGCVCTCAACMCVCVYVCVCMCVHAYMHACPFARLSSVECIMCAVLARHIHDTYTTYMHMYIYIYIYIHTYINIYIYIERERDITRVWNYCSPQADRPAGEENNV